MPAAYSNSVYALDDYKRKMVEENKGFIHHMTNTILNLYPDIPRDQYDDIFQDATIDFIKCLKEYDSSKSKITSYSSIKILQEHKRRMNRYIRNKNILGEYYFDDIVHKNDYDDDTLDINYVMYDKQEDFNHEDYIIDNIIKTDILKQLKEKFSLEQLDMIELYLMKDTKQTDIARKYGITRQRVGQIIDKFRKESQELMIENGVYKQ